MSAAPLDLDAPLVREDSTAQLIDAAIAEAIAQQRQRGHLGMSQIGKTDERTLWLQFRGCLPREHNPRTERIFRLGDAIELELARYVRMIPGVELHTEDPDGGQFRFALFGGHFGGSMDGALIGLPEAPQTWHVWEAKSVSAKRFRELEKKGVKDWSPEYYAQLQCYMGASGMERALFTSYCKDDSRIYTERVRFDPQEWDILQVKALRILEASDPPPSSFRDKTWYEAKWMPPVTSAVYWRERLPPRAHCRNCRFSEPVLSGQEVNWACSVAEDVIPHETVGRGCPAHQWIHALCPLDVLDADEQATTYRLPDGAEIRNGVDDYHSQELAEASKDGFQSLDALVRDIHTTFDARLTSVSDPLAVFSEDDIPF